MNIKELLISLGIDPEKAGECEKTITGELYKEYIPKGQYNKKVEENKSLEEKIKTFENNQSKSNQTPSTRDDEILKTLLEKMEKMEKARELDVLNVKKEQIKSELVKKGINEQMVDLILKNNELSGTNEEIINNITTEYKDFIPTTNIEGTPPSNSNSNVKSGGNTYTKDELSKMSEDDLNALIEKEPDFFAKITY